MQENSSSISGLNRPRTRSVHRLELSSNSSIESQAQVSTHIIGAAELSVRSSVRAVLPSLSPVESVSSSSRPNSGSAALVSPSSLSPRSSSGSVPSSLSSESVSLPRMAEINPPPAPVPIYIPSIPVYKAESSQDVEEKEISN